MPTPLEKFQSLLRELFQFEQADLDFGVYRIMNLRREHMERWLNEELPARARAILKQGGNTADDNLGGRLEVLKAALLELEPGGVDEDGNITKDFLKESTKGKEYLKLKVQADRAPARTAAGMEPLVYNHLYDFFSRYYDTGDFIPKRRRSFAPDGRDTYAIPWDGEEVVLHWANKDQYYIKTGERFTHYRWQSEVGGRIFTIEFRLTDADLPANNNKDAKKKFNLLVADKVEWQEDKATLILPFHYRGLTPEDEGQYTGTQEAKLRESIIKRTVDTLREIPAIAGVPQLATALLAPKRDAAGQEKRDKDGNAVPLLPHHLNRWAVKNESDFFIHKDLRRFLTGELDYFLKSVVLNLDNLLAAGEQRAEPNFRLLDAVKRLGTEIVDFVSQLEDFQKALFEKKKFVLETSWCLTLDRIPASVKEEVYAAILANDRQWEEWETLYKISQWPADLATVVPRTQGFLEAYPYLVINTGLKRADGSSAFAPALVDGILAGIEDLEEQTGGLAVSSDNFQALGLLSERYREEVKCVYIDPPYNTGGDGFVYKDTYQHSSWISMLADRMIELTVMMRRDAAFCASINEIELANMRMTVGGYLDFVNIVTVKTKVAGVSGSHHGKSLRNATEYLLVFSKEQEHFFFTDKVFDAQELLEFIEEMQAAGKSWKYTTVLESIDEGSYVKSIEDGAGNEIQVFKHTEFSLRSISRIAQDNFGGDLKKAYYANIDKIFRTTNAQSSVRQRVCDETGDIDSDIISIKYVPKTGRNAGQMIRLYYKDGERNLITFLRETVVVDGDVIAKKISSGNLWSEIQYNNLALEGGVPFPNGKKPLALVQKVISMTSEPDETTLDFFGGSGTTGHAVIGLNRKDSGTRKYILVEMGGYFDTALLPRLEKVVFSEQWKAGAPVPQSKPTNPYNGLSHCLKVLRLESYEDALDNIEFNSGAAPGAELGLDFRRDYELRYALDWESRDCPTRLAVEQLNTPFDYTLTLRRESGTVEVKPDLPETFAYLIGMHTRRRFRTEREGVSYLIYTGTLHADGTEVAVLWRTCKDWTEANLKAEMVWWREHRETLAPGASRVYVNGASAIEGHHSLDAEFKTRMHGGTV